MPRVLSNRAVLLFSGLVIASCGSTTPSAPSPATTAAQPAQTPALLGHWAGGGPVTYVDTATGRQWGISCARAVHVSAQQGGEFDGWLSSSGSSPTSDPHCGYGSNFTAHLTSGAFTMSPVTAPSGGGICPPQRPEVCCRRISGGETVTGTLIDDSNMKGSLTARASCMDPSGKPFDGEMTIEFTVTRLTTTP